MLIGARVKAKEDAFNRDGLDRLVKGAIYTVIDIDVGTIPLYRLQHLDGWWSSAKFDQWIDWDSFKYPMEVECISEEGGLDFLRIGRVYTATSRMHFDHGDELKVRDYAGREAWHYANKFKPHYLQTRDTRLYYTNDPRQGCFG